MSEERNISVQGLLDQAAESVRSTGVYTMSLGGPEVSSLIRGAIDQILAENPAVAARTPLLDVKIVDEAIDARGTVQIDSPTKLTTDVELVLQNNPGVPGSLRLNRFKLNPKGFVSTVALRGFGVEGMAQAALSDPTKSFMDYLSPLMEERGAKLHSVAMAIKSDNKLAVALNGPIHR